MTGYTLFQCMSVLAYPTLSLIQDTNTEKQEEIKDKIKQRKNIMEF